MSVKPWWERWPDRYEYELARLKAAGISYQVDETEKVQGRLVLHIDHTSNSQPLHLIAKFPDFYPYTRFEVYAQRLTLGRHQNPLNGQLCLIGRSTANWHTHDTLAEFIQKRIPLLLDTVKSQDPQYVASREEHQGEPFTAYFPYQSDAAVIVGPWKIDASARGGFLDIALESQDPVRGAILRVKDSRRNVLAQADPVVFDRYRDHRRCHGRWVRLDRPLDTIDPQAIFARLTEHDRNLAKPQYDRGLDFIALVCHEEAQWRTHADGWLFVLREKRGSKQKAPEYLRFVRALRASGEDFAARIPELRPLNTKRVAIIGLGTLGAPSAIEFARCGAAEARLLDYDFVEPGPTVRWPLGWDAFGRRKTTVIAEFISRHYPMCKASTFFHRVGSVEGPTRDGAVIDALLDGVDLIYDASAEFGINHLFSSLALEFGVPYVWVSTTPGAWGGVVGRIKNGSTKGCWKCYYEMLTEGVIQAPHEDPRPMVQPVGCSDLTFFGAGFDIGNIALAGVRLAVSTICADSGEGYPDVNWDVGVVNLRDSGGLPVPPTWTTYSLDEHSSHPHA